MPNIDDLSIQFKANGTETAIKNIKAMGYAVRNLAMAVKAVDTAKLGAFTSTMETVKKSVPTEAQVNRMVAFSNAIKDFSGVIGSANISGFSRDMSTLGEAMQTFKKSSVNSITNAVSAMQNLQTQTQETATTLSNSIPKNPASIKATDSKATINETRELVATLDKVQVKATGVTGVLQKMGMVVPTKKFKGLEESAEKIRQKYDEVRAALQKGLNEGSIESGGTEYRKKMAELDALRNKYDELIQKQIELSREGSGFTLNPNLTKSISAFKTGFSSVTNLVKTGLVGALKSVNNHIKSFNSRIKQAGSSFKNMITGGNSATKVAKKFANELLRVSKMLKLMVTRMALRAVIKEVGNGFKSLALHSEEFNNSMSSLVNGSKKLGYSFAAMVSPLINAFAPAIVYVINLLTKLVNIIQQVFGALTGAGTWNKAKDFTDSWADSISGASKDAKELKKTVLGFDELNQLQEKKDSGGGAGDIKDMFETMQIDPKWKDFADWLKDMWKMGDFTKLGEKLGKALRSLLESIPWDKIRKTAHKLGESLATLINGFIEVERLGYDIGYTIAQSVNTVFEFLNGFVHRLHWDSLGKFIGEAFNGLFENIDWPLIKDTVVTGMAGLAEAIQNFIDTFHWDNISNTIINGIDTVSAGVIAFIDGIEWRDLGQKIGDQIAKSIRGTDWRQVGEAIGAVIQAGVSWVAGLIEGLPSVEELVTAASNVLEGLFDRVDMYEMGANLGKILSYIYNFLTKFWDENGDLIKQKVGEFFKGIWDNIDKTELAKVLASILGVAALVGIAAIGWTALKNYVASKITAMLVSQAVTEAIAGGVTTAAGGTTVAAAAGGVGLTIGGYILGGILEFMSVHGIVNEIMQYLFPDEEVYKQYSGLTGGFKALADAGVGAANLVKMAWSGELAENNFYSNLSKQEQEYYNALKVHWGQDFPAYMQMNIDLFGGYEEAWVELKEEAKGYSDETKKKLEELAEGYKTNSSEITKANENIKNSLKSAGIDEQSILYKKLYEEMAVTTEQSKKVADEAHNISTAYKGPTDAVAHYKKETEETTKVTNDFVEKHRKSNEEWNKLQDSLGKVTTTVEQSKIKLDDLTKTNDNTSQSIKNLADTMSKDFGASSDEFNQVVKEMDEELSKSFSSLFEASKDVTETMPSDFAKGFDDIFKSETELTKNTDTSMSDILKIVDDSTKGITDDFDTIKNSMTKEQWTFDGVAEGLTETFRKAKEGIKGQWNQIANTLNGEHEVGGSKVKIDLPKFARGGFPEDGLFMANHHELVGHFSNGKTAVANNDQIIAGIETGVYSAVSKAMAQNNGGSQYISNEIIMDGEVVARSISKAQNRQNMRYSPQTV